MFYDQMSIVQNVYNKALMKPPIMPSVGAKYLYH